MKDKTFSRRGFMHAGAGMAAGVASGTLLIASGCTTKQHRPLVSIVRIKNDNTGYAVEKAIDLLGGISEVTKGKGRIMLKPNLVIPSPDYTTKPAVMKALAQMMKKARKEVFIGEGSAGAAGFNLEAGEVYRTKKREILDPMQQFVFDKLGYSELSKSLKVPLVNLHSGEMAEVRVPNGYVFDKVTIHKSLAETDLLCSVPMMKTHSLATVTLGMKNLIGIYPGTVYYSARSWLHDYAEDAGSVGIAGEIVDMVRATKLGLVVVDGSMALEGQGPTTGGTLVKMDVIIAGTNPLATDMVTASIMGFDTKEIPTFTWAQKAGMKPTTLEEIDIRGEKPERVRRNFVKPNVIAWKTIRKTWGVKEK
jgi:uncharacterized protein (DUF362 family)